MVLFAMRMPVPVDNYIYNDLYSMENCHVKLQNVDLWNRFHKYQTEMIITKGGRRLFPVPAFNITGLDPMRDYCVFLEITLVSRCRYKYATSIGWSPAGPEESQSSRRLYLHPQAPAKGSHWMSKDVFFDKLKITNTSCNPPADQIVLSSMHLYQPRLIIAMTPNPDALSVAPVKCVAFSETQFYAVTAYQNKNIVQLKIENNPYAKGFLKTEKPDQKRKQSEEHASSPCSKKSVTSSPSPVHEHEDNNPQDEVTPDADISPSYDAARPVDHRRDLELKTQSFRPYYPYYCYPEENMPPAGLIPVALDYHHYYQHPLFRSNMSGVNDREFPFLIPYGYYYPYYPYGKPTEVAKPEKSTKLKAFTIDAILKS